MILLILGVFLWIAVHSFKRLSPARRAAMGDKGKGPIALLILLSVVLMVIGYRRAWVDNLYDPIAGMGHLNNLLMLISIYLFGVTPAKSVLADKIRHPMLWGVVVWAVAHLLVNGDWASVILFGGMIFWAVSSMALINKAEGPWQRPAPGAIKGDIRNLVITLVIYGVIVGIHFWLGHPTFAGTYG